MSGTILTVNSWHWKVNSNVSILIKSCRRRANSSILGVELFNGILTRLLYTPTHDLHTSIALEVQI